MPDHNQKLPLLFIRRSVMTPKNMHRSTVVLLSISLVAVMFFSMWQTIQAQKVVLLPPDLSNSSKEVNTATAFPGSTVQYTIVLSNTGDITAFPVNMTDTLPLNLSYVAGSLVASEGIANEAGGEITWQGAVNINGSVSISFDALISDMTPAASIITNTAIINYDGLTLNRTASTTIITDSITFLPIVFKPVPLPVSVPVLASTFPDSNNAWTLSWTMADTTNTTGYHIEEAQNNAFINSTITDVGDTFAHDVTKPFGTNPYHFFRARAYGPGGYSAWSNTVVVIAGYYDGFDDDTTGWTMRRQDTDTVINQTYYRNGHFVLEMDSGYDYQLAAPMLPTPAGPYRIETRIKYTGVDNLHTYGIIFGGDWDGTECPNADYSSCFNNYYRLSVIWSGNLDQELKVQLKRIDFHEEDDNVGRGPELFLREITVNDPPEGYQTWVVEVNPNTGSIKIFVNGSLVREVFDTTYTGYRYFGVFSSTDEYTGLEAEYDYFKVSALD